MSIGRPSRFARHLMLVAPIVGATLAASAAGAQNVPSAPGPYRYEPNEQVEIISPRLHIERDRLGGRDERASMSQAVRFDDLDLRTAWGARMLRDRIRFAASSVCGELHDLYPYPMPVASCYRAAVEDAMLRADAAIDDARGDYNPL